MSGGQVVVDLVAPQSPSYRERGIARHGLDFANALVDRHPDLIDRVLLHPELPPAGGLEHLIATGKVRTDLAGIGLGGVFHVTSAFEPEVGVRELWPRVISAHRMRLVVTVYDLIPDIFPEMYLLDPGLRRRWRSCRELARIADRVLVLSDSGAEDVVRLLGVPAQRVTVIGAGCDTRFHPPRARPEALAAARSAVAGLGEHFIVYNGAIDPRKNIDRLIEAYAQLPSTIRDRWQLVLVCRAEPLQRNHLLVMAEKLGCAGRVMIPGFVPDADLVSLYQSADLSVFPSLYEGYGLPVVEAQACGAPVIAADNSSLRELVRPEACFDGSDVGAISAAMHRALTDEPLRALLLADARRPPPTWGQVADRTAEVYEDLIERDRGRRLTPGWKRRRNVALVSPLPVPGAGVPGPAAAYGEALAAALAATGVELDCFADGDDVDPSPDGARRQTGSQATTRPRRLRPPALPRMDRWRGGYDLVVCCIGDDRSHLGALRLLLNPDFARLPVVVIAHQVELAPLFEASASNGGLGADLASVVHAIYPGLPPEVAADGHLDPATVRRHGLVLARPVIAASRRYLVSNIADLRVARVDAHPDEAHRVELLPPASLAEALLSGIGADPLGSVDRTIANGASGTR